ncbi:MAG: TRAP transporter small permease [Proteobacteria bacterium]|nr:TRAP transporter small permease [Pseudomonadota bacterium]
MAAYRRAMDVLYLLCVGIAGLCLVVMTMVIPVGVYWRYVLNAALPWPEPMSVLLVIVFTFLAAAACYLARVHISVVLVTDALPPNTSRRVTLAADIFMTLLSLFMLIWGVRLVETTWYQVIAEFPFLSVGVTYMPIPIGAVITLLFIAERLWIGAPPPDSFIYREPSSVN